MDHSSRRTCGKTSAVTEGPPGYGWEPIPVVRLACNLREERYNFPGTGAEKGIPTQGKQREYIPIPKGRAPQKTGCRWHSGIGAERGITWCQDARGFWRAVISRHLRRHDGGTAPVFYRQRHHPPSLSRPKGPPRYALGLGCLPVLQLQRRSRQNACAIFQAGAEKK